MQLSRAEFHIQVLVNVKSGGEGLRTEFCKWLFRRLPRKREIVGSITGLENNSYWHPAVRCYAVTDCCLLWIKWRNWRLLTPRHKTSQLYYLYLTFSLHTTCPTCPVVAWVEWRYPVSQWTKQNCTFFLMRNTFGSEFCFSTLYKVLYANLIPGRVAW